jgi:hypothetical protein
LLDCLDHERTPLLFWFPRGTEFNAEPLAVSSPESARRPCSRMDHGPDTPQCEVPFSGRGDTKCEHGSLDGDHSLSKNHCECTALYSVYQYSLNVDCVDHQETALFHEAVGHIDESGRSLRSRSGLTYYGAERPVSKQLPAVREARFFGAATAGCGRSVTFNLAASPMLLYFYAAQSR